MLCIYLANFVLVNKMLTAFSYKRNFLCYDILIIY